MANCVGHDVIVLRDICAHFSNGDIRRLDAFEWHVRWQSADSNVRSRTVGGRMLTTNRCVLGVQDCGHGQERRSAMDSGRPDRARLVRCDSVTANERHIAQ